MARGHVAAGPRADQPCLSPCVPLSVLQDLHGTEPELSQWPFSPCVTAELAWVSGCSGPAAWAYGAPRPLTMSSVSS